MLSYNKGVIIVLIDIMESCGVRMVFRICLEFGCFVDFYVFLLIS